eukprot:Skav209746  [mRNA]  locus=scaffold9:19802:22674:- [translate_table: standard]
MPRAKSRASCAFGLTSLITRRRSFVSKTQPRPSANFRNRALATVQRSSTAMQSPESNTTPVRASSEYVGEIRVSTSSSQIRQ